MLYIFNFMVLDVVYFPQSQKSPLRKTYRILHDVRIDRKKIPPCNFRLRKSTELGAFSQTKVVRFAKI